MKKFFVGLMALLVSATVFAERVTQDDAALVANHFMNVAANPRVRKALPAKHMVMKKAATATENQYYIYENANGEGWVMIAANDIAHPIMAYSETGQFRTDNQPDNLKVWLGQYDKKIQYAEQNGIEATDEVKAEWAALRNGVRMAKASVVVAPLIQTTWDQDNPYWQYCPSKGSEKTYVGCVATAMAQVMNYWKWPKQGTGSYSYTSNQNSLSCSANFGNTTYDWDNMVNHYTTYYSGSSQVSAPTPTTAQKEAVATLMYHCGVAVEMDYGVASQGGSGAQTIYPNASNTTAKCAQDALWRYFGYKKSSLKGYYRPGGYGYSAVNEATWLNLLKTELDAHRPIMYAGADSEGGHSFVCDGYDSDNKFHFNWGWSGYCDGYYSVNNMVPGSGGSGAGNGSYNDDQDIIIGIEPDADPVSVTGVSVAPTELTLKIKERSSLTATVTPNDASISSVVWSSNNESVATVSSTGVVTGISAGSATITATTVDGGFTATCAVTVTNEVVPAIALEVDYARAKYQTDDDYWILIAYDSATEVPWVQFYFESSSNKIAGTYDLADSGAYLWNDPDDEDASVQATSGQLNIQCIGKDDGSNGCNTYQITATFTCNDGMDYTLNATLEVCASNSSNTAIDLADNAGDGAPIEVTWLASGDNFATTLAVDGGLVLPATTPAACESGKVFVGWSKDEIDETDTKPTFAKNGDAVTANTTYYAVYATQEGEGSAYITKTMSTFSATSGNIEDDANLSYTAAQGTASTAPAVNGGEIRIYQNGGTLTVTANNGKKITDLTIGSSMETTIKYAIDGGSASSNQSISAGGTFSLSDIEATSILFTCTGTDKNHRLYLNYLSATYPGDATYSGYTTTCGAPAPKYAITVNTATNGSLATSPATEAAAGRTVTVTATPATHYHLATLTVKDASNNNVTVSGTGNTRTFVMPAEAVTVSGTFAVDDKYTVRFIDKGVVISSEDYFIGETAEKPANPSADCADYTFVGWWTAELAADNTTAQTWKTNFTVSGAQDYYAIYSKTEVGELGTNYNKITDLEDLTTGNYVVAGNSSYAMKNSIYSSYYLAAASVTASANVISNPANNVIWQITRSGDNVSFYNAAVSQYVCLFQSGTHYNLKLQDDANWFTATVSSGNWSFESNDCSGYYLVHTVYNSTHEFAAKTSSSYTIQLFKQQYNSTTYYSSVVSCSATAIENNVVAPKAQKVIENGQIVIIRGNEKYTIFGQKIQ